MVKGLEDMVSAASPHSRRLALTVMTQIQKVINHFLKRA
jgi:hypothetical protein